MSNLNAMLPVVLAQSLSVAISNRMPWAYWTASCPQEHMTLLAPAPMDDEEGPAFLPLCGDNTCEQLG